MAIHTRARPNGTAMRSESFKAIEAIEAFNAALPIDDRQAKYAKMAISPYSFYRGTNHLFWTDVVGGRSPRAVSQRQNSHLDSGRPARLQFRQL